MQHRYNSKHSFVTKAILDAIERDGPMTRKQVCRAIGRDRQEVASVVSRLSKPLKTMPKRLFICDWVNDDEGEKTFPRAVYDIGDRPNKKRPPLKSNTQHQREYRLKKKLKVSSIFDLGISRRKHEQRAKQVRANASGRGPLQETKDSAHEIQHGEQPRPMSTYGD